MRTFFTLGLTGMLALGTTGLAIAQENTPQPQGPNQARPGIHGPRSIDQELDHLTKDLELTANQRKQVRPLVEKHHDRLQALFDRNPGVSRKDLGPQIHAISDETHHEIHALLTEHQKQLEKAMQERMHAGEESRRSAPSTPSR
jgi:Spy/CpxP family protein refolding chaperone